MKLAAPIKPTFISLGIYEFAPGRPALIVLDGKDANGNLHSDAVQLIPVK
jgi:hypothetical protein